jgi:vacuolar-type H+-ATPase subunit I/STV1
MNFSELLSSIQAKCKTKQGAGGERVFNPLSSVPDYKELNVVPQLTGVVNPEEIKAAIKKIEDLAPSVSFEQEKILQRRAFLSRYEDMVKRALEKCAADLERWSMLKQDYDQLVSHDQQIRALRQELKVSTQVVGKRRKRDEELEDQSCASEEPMPQLAQQHQPVCPLFLCRLLH